jgi:hypothetical protein
MLTFKTFLNEAVGRGTIKATGDESVRHEAKYVDPHIGSKTPTHTLASPTPFLPAGSNVSIYDKSRDESGKLHLHVRDENGGKHKILASKIHKPGEAPENKGTSYEAQTFERMKKAGITPPGATPAGSTHGTDVPIVNKRKNTKHKGRIKDSHDLLSGEVKEGTTAAMGQLTIHHTKEKGWHIPDKARENRPEYAKAIEDAGILKHMNKYSNPDKHKIETTASGRSKSIVIKHPNLEPARSYLRDHHVDVLHVGSGYGTYRVGDKDVTGHGLPPIEGKGKFTVREKQLGNKRARTVMFQPDGSKGLNRSHVNLDKDDHLEEFAKTLGHRENAMTKKTKNLGVPFD